MWCVKHLIVSSAALTGGVFGFVTAKTPLTAQLAGFGFMVACAAVADWLTRSLEEDEEDADGDAAAASYCD